MANYATEEDLIAVYGKAAIYRWANIDNDKDTALRSDRIDFMLTTATEYFNDRLRKGHYVIPFTTVPHTVKFMTAMYAGILLYDARQITSTESRDDLVRQRKDVDQFLKQILRGQLKFDLEVACKQHLDVVVEEDE